MITDELMAEMTRITEEKKAISKEASSIPDLKIDESQFSILYPDTQNDFSITEVAFIENAVVKEAVDSDSALKEILKEKKKATDFPDIVEEAHPETAFMAEGPMGTGVVENQNQQHEKLLNIVYRMPSGFHYNKFASLISELSTMASDLEAKGDLDAAKQVDSLACELVKGKSFLEVTSKIEKGADVPEPVWEGTSLVKRTPTVPEVLPPAKNVPPAQKALNAPHKPGTGMTKVKPIYVKPPIAPPAAPKMLTGKPPIVPPAASKMLTGKVSIWSRLAKALKGKGKAGMVMAGVGVAAYILNQLSSQEQAIHSNSSTLDTATNQQVSKASRQFTESLRKANQELQDNNAAMAAEHLKACEDQLNYMQQAAQTESPEIQAAVQSLVKGFSEAGGKTNAFVNTNLQEHGASVQQDRARIKGIQKFFQDHADKTHPINGVMGTRTENSIHDFVEGMREGLAIAPKMLTTKNLIERGTNQKFEKLMDIWKRPHMFATKVD